MGGSHTNTTGGTHNTVGGTHNTVGGTHNTVGGTRTTTGGTHTMVGGTHNTVGGTHNATTGGAHNTMAGSHNTMGGAHNMGTAHNTMGGPHNAAAMNRTPPGRTLSLKGGGSASIRPNGQIRSINRNGMHIEHSLNGNRHIEGVHNGARVVNTGAHSGYVQRNYVTRNGTTYVSRTTVVNNTTYVSVYRSYSYGGHCCYYGYYHPYFYAPVYYGWAYNPWPAPVYWGWGWGGAPWYGYYGGYFAPYPVYPTAAFWLTDWFIAAELQSAYAARAQAAADAAAANAPPSNDGGDNPVASNGGGADSGSGQVTLTPEVKQAIAEEVKAQLAAAQSEAGQQGGGSSGGGQAPAPASGTVPPALDPAHRTFVVSSDLAVVSDGQECTLSQGDVITRITDTPDDDRKVTASVSASKKNDCAAGKNVAVSVDDLQEMHNHFEQQLDEGLKTLATKQGTGGLPKAPDTSTVASDVPPPPPDKSAAKALEDQQAAADKAEADVKQEASATTAGGLQ
jgi:hypothetical protein